MVVFENISIRYLQEQVLHGFSMSVNLGEKISLSGSSGSGKSTILASILGFVSPDNGVITVDKLPVNATNIHHIRSISSWLPQELSFDVKQCKSLVMLPFLFKQNKAITPSIKNVQSLMERLLLDPCILDKQTSEISGGQKQRLLLTSVLLLKKPILLLDEPNSALDLESTNALLSEIFKLEKTTVISCSHDPIWNQGMQRIIHIKQNK